MGKMKRTRVSRVIRIPLVVWDRYNLNEEDYEADWYDALDNDIDREVDGRSAVVVYFKKKEK